MKTPIEFWQSKLSYFVLLASEYYPILPENLDKFKDFWIWNKISCNPFIIWTPKLLEQYKYDLDWRWYCWHNDLPYIKQDDYLFYQSINWAEQSWYTQKERIAIILGVYQKWRFPVDSKNYNRKIRPNNWRKPWHEFIFTEFDILTEVHPKVLQQIIDNPCGDYSLDDSPYEKTHIPLEFIRKHKDILDWKRLSYSCNLPWCFELISEFEELWNYENMQEQFILMEFALRPFLTNEFIVKVLNKQQSKDIGFIDEYYLGSAWYYQII